MTATTQFYGREICAQPHPLVPTIDSYIFDESDPVRVMATRIFAKRENLILWGDTGNGKTEHIKWMAAQVGLPLYQVQGRKDLTYEDLTGDWRPNTDPTSSAPFVFCDGSLSLACRDGGIFLLDEAASVPQGTLNGLNELLNSTSLVINTDRGHRVIERHPNFQVAMTFNPPDRYSGNQELNLAFLNRFHVFKWDYLPAAAEERLLRERFPSIERGTVRNVVAFANEIRAHKATSEQARYVLSHRDAIKLCEYIAMDVPAYEAVTLAILSVVELVASDELPAITEMAAIRFKAA